MTHNPTLTNGPGFQLGDLLDFVRGESSVPEALACIRSTVICMPSKVDLDLKVMRVHLDFRTLLDESARPNPNKPYTAPVQVEEEHFYGPATWVKGAGCEAGAPTGYHPDVNPDDREAFLALLEGACPWLTLFG